MALNATVNRRDSETIQKHESASELYERRQLANKFLTTIFFYVHL